MADLTELRLKACALGPLISTGAYKLIAPRTIDAEEAKEIGEAVAKALKVAQDKPGSVMQLSMDKMIEVDVASRVLKTALSGFKGMKGFEELYDGMMWELPNGSAIVLAQNTKD